MDSTYQHSASWLPLLIQVGKCPLGMASGFTIFLVISFSSQIFAFSLSPVPSSSLFCITCIVTSSLNGI